MADENTGDYFNEIFSFKIPLVFCIINNIQLVIIDKYRIIKYAEFEVR